MVLPQDALSVMDNMRQETVTPLEVARNAVAVIVKNVFRKKNVQAANDLERYPVALQCQAR